MKKLIVILVIAAVLITGVVGLAFIPVGSSTNSGHGTNTVPLCYWMFHSSTSSQEHSAPSEEHSAPPEEHPVPPEEEHPVIPHISEP